MDLWVFETKIRYWKIFTILEFFHCLLIIISCHCWSIRVFKNANLFLSWCIVLQYDWMKVYRIGATAQLWIAFRSDDPLRTFSARWLFDMYLRFVDLFKCHFLLTVATVNTWIIKNICLYAIAAFSLINIL
jgi:hypothetical protein